MLVSETYINKTEGHIFSESEVYEPWTDNTGKLFRSMQAEYGRCVSSVYIDGPNNGLPIKIGWVFEKTMQYENSPDTYVREVWITLYDRFERSVKIDSQYHELT